VAPQYIAHHRDRPAPGAALFCAAFAWEERTVFWRYAAAVRGAYAFDVPVADEGPAGGAFLDAGARD
jgi:hypothetical protein